MNSTVQFVRSCSDPSVAVPPHRPRKYSGKQILQLLQLYSDIGHKQLLPRLIVFVPSMSDLILVSLLGSLEEPTTT